MTCWYTQYDHNGTLKCIHFSFTHTVLSQQSCRITFWENELTCIAFIRLDSVSNMLKELRCWSSSLNVWYGSESVDCELWVDVSLSKLCWKRCWVTLGHSSLNCAANSSLNSTLTILDALSRSMSCFWWASLSLVRKVQGSRKLEGSSILAPWWLPWAMACFSKLMLLRCFIESTFVTGNWATLLGIKYSSTFVTGCRCSFCVLISAKIWFRCTRQRTRPAVVACSTGDKYLPYWRDPHWKVLPSSSSFPFSLFSSLGNWIAVLLKRRQRTRCQHLWLWSSSSL